VFELNHELLLELKYDAINEYTLNIEYNPIARFQRNSKQDKTNMGILDLMNNST
jgi:hypothetical protein